MNVTRRPTVLLTGGSGFLGSLAAASLLAGEECDLLLPVRSHHGQDQLLWHIGFGLKTLGLELTPALRERIRFGPPLEAERLKELEAALEGAPLAEVVHCAGCLDYFDKATLEAVNVGLTERLVDLALRRKVDRFTYLSTAYSCGYLEGTAPEGPHPDPAADPTDYTRTKRAAERLVAGSGLRFQVLRPSIVVGTIEGQYTGKRYGLYQLWNGMERLLCKKWLPVLHVVAPQRKVSLLHQDAFQRAFMAVRRDLPEAPYVHLTSRYETAPTMRQIWDLWNQACARPREVVYYDKVDDVPLLELDSRQRAFLSLAWANLQISSRHWHFATGHLEALRQRGLQLDDVTLASTELCQRRFIEGSEVVQRFIQLYHRAA
ncbi:MAG TPA: SDR family oxidoreductase [Myxococcaceae bacterium]|nr:SDR family oxidoreductase [Myxococcaceae bacterium]